MLTWLGCLLQFFSITSVFQLGHVKIFPSFILQLHPSSSLTISKADVLPTDRKQTKLVWLKSYTNQKTQVRKIGSSKPRKHVPASRPHTTPFTFSFLFMKDNTSTWFCPSCTQLSSLQQRAQQWMTGFIFQDKEDKVRGTVLLCWLFMAALLAQSSLVNQRDG